ncbi:MAG: serine hydrolase [Ignavibacteriaceae bacterium]|nr:serine hydrolase [Ignavibacteriaceae bacterium]
MKTILLIGLLTLSQIAFPQNTNTRIDSLLNEALQQDIFSGVVLIANRDSVQYLKAIGYSDWNTLSPNLTDTKFNIGSIGKLFTQILITQLIQEGKLSLSDNLAKLYPLYKNESNEKITVKLLLTFSAGIGDYFQISEFMKHSDKYRKTEDLISLISKESLLYEPGTSSQYSNSSYVVLGGIIEKLTGKSYLENLKERILNPLKMNNSGFIYKDTKVENKAKGFIVNPAGQKVSTYENTPSVPTPAGGMYSTAEDLLKLDRSFMNNNLLLNDEYKALLLNRFNEDNKKTWQEIVSEQGRGFLFAGGSPGWNAIYNLNFAGKYTVIILSNIDQGAQRINKQIDDILLGKDVTPLVPSADKVVLEIIKEKGADYFTKNYEEALKGISIDNDRILNSLGYIFFQQGKTEEAISVFTVNTKLFPDIANTFDSLGEAYLKAGNKELAIENYMKAFEMDPNNKNAEKILKDLTRQ